MNMKKLLYFLCFGLIAFNLNSQTILDFEAAETSTHFQYFGSTIDGTLNSIIANPNPTGINTSDSVAVYIKPANSETWAGAFSNPAPSMTIDATNGGQVCIDVHMDHIGNLAFKLENGNGAQNWTTVVENTVVNEWETLCFNFDNPSTDQTTTPATGNVYSTIVLFFDFGSNDTSDVTTYFDNIEVEAGESSGTILDIVVNSPDHTILETAVGAAGLAETLSGPGPFTLFAPTDAAIGSLPAGTLDALLADPTGALKDILLYHALSAKVLSTDLVNGTTATTINGKDVTITINDDGVFINNAKVIVADLVADNGVVHVIDAVLLPPADPDNKTVILDFESPETSTNFQYFGSTLDGTLNTIIANPNPTGINTSDSVAVYIKAANSETWAGAFSNPAPTMTIDATNGGQVCIDVHMDHIGNLAFKLENGNGAQNWTTVVENTKVNEWETLCFNFDNPSTDQTTTPATGNVYSTIVLFFDFGSNDTSDVTTYFDNIEVEAGEASGTTILDIVVNSPDHTILETAVGAAGLAGTLSGPGPFTLFAPTDAAIGSLPAGTLEALLADPTGALKDILLYHALSSKVLSGDLVNGSTATTINGKDVTITINDDGVFINTAKVIVADLEADNGVVHVIDAVLLPPSDPENNGVILDFEKPETSTHFQYFGSTADGTLNTIIANPNPTGINTSDSVAVYIKPANSETWAGAFSNPNPTMKVDATNGGQVCIDVHMDHIGNLAFKLENGTASQNWLTVVENTKVNEWETLCFDFDAASTDQTTISATGKVYSTIVLFFDFGANSTSPATSYFDNVIVMEPTSSVFENVIPQIDFQLAPNLTNDRTVVTWSDLGKKNISIYNTNGILVENYKVSEYATEQVIDVNQYVNGVYFVKIDMGNKFGIKKLVVGK